MIGMHLRGLRRFSDRETRAQFWPWAGIVFAVAMIPGIGCMIPAMLGSFEKMQRFAAQHPEQVTVVSGPGHYEMRIDRHHPELMPDMSLLMTGMWISVAMMIVLLAAAVARRLHDTGRRGAWGLLPLPFLFCGFVLMPRMFAATPDMGLFGLLFLNNALYLAALATLVALLAQPTNGR